MAVKADDSSDEKSTEIYLSSQANLYHLQMPLNDSYDNMNTRFIVISPAENFKDTLTCRMLMANVVDSPQSWRYYALSYVWGTEAAEENILCNGHSVLVTKNLLSALRHIRARNDTMPLWVDHLCINQGDDAEKTKQVRLMGEIYSRASLVIHWLGEQEQGDELGVQWAYEMASSVSEEYVYGCMQNPDTTLSNGNKLLSSLKYSWKKWTPLLRLIGNEYFRRVWIIQEITEARISVFCRGGLNIDRKTLLVAATLAACHLDTRTAFSSLLPKESMISMSNATQLLLLYAGRVNGYSWSLTELLVKSVGFDSTDPRDRLFALIGLTQCPPQHLIDYQKTLKNTCIDAARYLYSGCPTILNVGSLNIMLIWSELYGCNTQDGENWPSWVPDFSAHHTTGVLMGKFITEDAPNQWMRISCDNIAIVPGRVCDTIRTLLSPVEGTTGILLQPANLIPKTNAELDSIFAWYEKCYGEARAGESATLESRFAATFCFASPSESADGTARYHAHLEAFKSSVNQLRSSNDVARALGVQVLRGDATHPAPKGVYVVQSNTSDCGSKFCHRHSLPRGIDYKCCDVFDRPKVVAASYTTASTISKHGCILIRHLYRLPQP